MRTTIRSVAIVLVATLLGFGGLALQLGAEGDDFGWGFTVPAVLMIAVGSFLMVRRPANRIGVVLGGGGAAWLLYTAAGEYARIAQAQTGTGELPAEYVAAWLGSWVGALLPISLAALIVLFPDGRLTGFRRWFAYALLALAALAFSGGLLLWGETLVVLADFQLLDLEPAYVPVDIAFGLGFLAVVPATLSLIGRYRSGDAVERQQVKWVLAAAGLFGVVFLAGVLFVTEGRLQTIWEGALGISISSIPVAIAVAVFRYRLYEIDTILSRTVSYALVVGLLGLVVLALITAMTVFLPSDDPLVVAAATLAVFALFNPVRRRVQRWVDRRFNRSRYDATTVVDDFTGDLRDRVDPEEVVQGWVGVIETTMEPASVGVWVKR